MKVVVSLSGGMDSATLLAKAIHEGAEVLPISFIYPSKHNRYESRAVLELETYYNIHTRGIDLEDAFQFTKSNLLNHQGEIPEGHYEAESMNQTVVPGRNTIFAAILSSIAESEGASKIYIGIHAGDHAIYPDCRPNWYKGMQSVIGCSTEDKVGLIAPFLYWSKGKILEYGLSLGVPYHLTRTCYKDQEIACGKCGSCQERLAAFLANGVEDPIPYESREILPK